MAGCLNSTKDQNLQQGCDVVSADVLARFLNLSRLSWDGKSYIRMKLGCLVLCLASHLP